MMVIQLREAAQDKAFELIDDMKDLDRKKKMIVCELEDTLYDCFDSDENLYEDEPEYRKDDDMDYRYQKEYRYGRRHTLHDEMHKDDDDMDEPVSTQNMRAYRRRNMRMRRNRMGRFA